MIEQAISITELQLTIKKGLNSVLDPSYWIIAEVGQVNIASNGHCYMDLIERGENSSYTTAKISAAIWRYEGSTLQNHFLKATNTPICVGMKLLVCGKVSYHELYGLSITIQDIEPSYTIGEAEKIRRQTIERLEKEGYMELNDRITPTGPVKRIAIVSSEKAAGYGDFCNELLNNNFGYWFDITLFNATMQGNGAEESIINALDRIYRRKEEFDIVIIVRGGGSTDDLSCFNSYDLAVTIALSPLMVITGIGHDRDQSIADMVAALSLKTPTAVARHLIDCTNNHEHELLEYKDFLISTYQYEKKRVTEQILHSSQTLKNLVQKSVLSSDYNLSRREQLIAALAKDIIHNHKSELKLKRNQIDQLCKTNISRGENDISRTYHLLQNNALRALSDRGNMLHIASAQIAGFEPERILKMGYAIAKVNGRYIKSGKDIEVSQVIDLVLNDAIVKTSVTNITYKK